MEMEFKLSPNYYYGRVLNLQGSFLRFFPKIPVPAKLPEEISRFLSISGGKPLKKFSSGVKFGLFRLETE